MPGGQPPPLPAGPARRPRSAAATEPGQPRRGRALLPPQLAPDQDPAGADPSSHRGDDLARHPRAEHLGRDAALGQGRSDDVQRQARARPPARRPAAPAAPGGRSVCSARWARSASTVASVRTCSTSMPVPVRAHRSPAATSTGRSTSSQVATVPCAMSRSPRIPPTARESSRLAARASPRARGDAPGTASTAPPGPPGARAPARPRRRAGRTTVCVRSARPARGAGRRPVARRAPEPQPAPVPLHRRPDSASSAAAPCLPGVPAVTASAAPVRHQPVSPAPASHRAGRDAEARRGFADPQEIAHLAREEIAVVDTAHRASTARLHKFSAASDHERGSGAVRRRTLSPATRRTAGTTAPTRSGDVARRNDARPGRRVTSRLATRPGSPPEDPAGR